MKWPKCAKKLFVFVTVKMLKKEAHEYLTRGLFCWLVKMDLEVLRQSLT